MGIEPKLAELFTHGHHGVNIGHGCSGLANLLHKPSWDFFEITVHPALGRYQD
jgi:hypothetical protein